MPEDTLFFDSFLDPKLKETEMVLKYFTLLGTLAIVLQVGCSSLTTTPLTRLGSGSVVGDSNGKQRWFQKSRPFRGVPVKIKIQSHVDVWIDEDYLLARDGKHDKWVEKNLKKRFLIVRTKPVMTDKIVITDFKRPASGVIDLTVDFTGDQYFKKIDSKVQDSTITDSAALLSTIITKTGLSGQNKNDFRENDQGKDVNHSWESRTIAYRRFDINALDYESELEAFLDKHLNGCNQCSLNPVYSSSLPSTVTGPSTNVAPSIDEISSSPARPPVHPLHHSSLDRNQQK